MVIIKWIKAYYAVEVNDLSYEEGVRRAELGS